MADVTLFITTDESDRGLFNYSTIVITVGRIPIVLMNKSIGLSLSGLCD